MMRRVVPVVLLLAASLDALARVGGGDSYSGGGGSSGGGGDGDGELLFLVFRFLFWLTIEHPVVGIPVDICVIAGFIIWKRRTAGKGKVQVFRVSTATAAAEHPQPRLDGLRRFDPNFSEITFADFCYSLYARAHHARGSGDLGRLAPYLGDTARATLEALNPPGLGEVKGIVIGSFRVVGITGLNDPTVRVTVAFESNMTEVTATGENSWYVGESWVLERKRDMRSPPPAKMKADHCPRCGAALQTRTDGSCDYCGIRIASGAFQWFVQAITPVTRESRGPLLTSDVPERGTDLPTILQPQFANERAAFEAAHPEFRWEDFLAHVAAITAELQEAWTARDWERVRPLETESLFQMHRYWIDAYKRQALRNVVDDYALTQIEPVKISIDAFYEAITVRIHARGRDYTVDDEGKVVAGSKTSPRSWSEYWTLIRSRSGGAETNVCPNCGAKVDSGASAICPYCSGKLTSGTFDWALSRIEQDEAYRG